jgi:transposase-like protein
MNCPKCNSDRVKKNGQNKSGTQKWYCNECDHPYSEGDNPQHRPPINGVSAMTDAERAKNYYWRKKKREGSSD